MAQVFRTVLRIGEDCACIRTPDGTVLVRCEEHRLPYLKSLGLLEADAPCPDPCPNSPGKASRRSPGSAPRKSR